MRLTPRGSLQNGGMNASLPYILRLVKTTPHVPAGCRGVHGGLVVQIDVVAVVGVDVANLLSVARAAHDHGLGQLGKVRRAGRGQPIELFSGVTCIASLALVQTICAFAPFRV